METLTAYITYARSRIHPVLTEEASDALVKSYVEMRKVGEDIRTQERRITATTRQLESMIRLSEAHARMRFSERVEMQDVKEAFRLIRDAIRESAVSPGRYLCPSLRDLIVKFFYADGSYHRTGESLLEPRDCIPLANTVFICRSIWT